MLLLTDISLLERCFFNDTAAIVFPEDSFERIRNAYTRTNRLKKKEKEMKWKIKT